MAPPGSRSATQAREHLMTVLGPVVAATGHDLEDVSVSAAGRRSLVRVTVDADGGVDLDAVADVSRAISESLDEGDDAFSGPYVLEVSSPGVDRPLTEPRHWRRAAGRLVQVSAAGAALTGRVTATDADDAQNPGVTFDVDGTQRHIAFADLGTGKVQVEFNRPGAAGDDVAAEDADDSQDDPDNDDEGE